jgi:hypothetical protein
MNRRAGFLVAICALALTVGCGDRAPAENSARVDGQSEQTEQTEQAEPTAAPADKVH